MKQWVAGLLKPFAVWCFNLVDAVPMPVVRGIYLSIFIIIAIWVMTLPKQLPEGETNILKDLRLMAIGVLILHSVCYIIF